MTEFLGAILFQTTTLSIKVIKKCKIQLER